MAFWWAETKTKKIKLRAKQICIPCPKCTEVRAGENRRNVTGMRDDSLNSFVTSVIYCRGESLTQFGRYEMTECDGYQKREKFHCFGAQ